MTAPILKSMNYNRQLHLILYGLKKRYGTRLTVRRVTNKVFDPATGKEDIVSEDVTVKAIVLPVKTFRDYVYDLSFIAANKNFTYGGHFDTAERFVIIEVKDLPDGFSFSMNDRVVHKNQLYESKQITDFESDVVIILQLKGVIELNESAP